MIPVSATWASGNINYMFQSQYACNGSSSTNNYLVVWQGDDNTAPLVMRKMKFSAIYHDGQVQRRFGFQISDMGPDGSPSYDAISPKIKYDPQPSGVSGSVAW